MNVKWLPVVAVLWLLAGCAEEAKESAPAAYTPPPKSSFSVDQKVTLVEDSGGWLAVTPDKESCLAFEKAVSSDHVAAVMNLPGHAFNAESGSHAKVLETDSMPGLARIEITDGVCKDKRGWTLMTHLR